MSRMKSSIVIIGGAGASLEVAKKIFTKQLFNGEGIIQN